MSAIAFDKASHRRWYHRKLLPESPKATPKSSRFRIFGKSKTVSNEKHDTVKSKNKNDEITRSGKTKSKRDGFFKRRSNKSVSTELSPTYRCPAHPATPDSCESLPMFDGDVQFTKIQLTRSCDGTIRLPFVNPSPSAVRDVDDLFVKVSALRDRLKLFETKVRSSDTKFRIKDSPNNGPKDRSLEVTILSKPNNKNLQEKSNRADALSVIRESTNTSCTNKTLKGKPTVILDVNSIVTIKPAKQSTKSPRIVSRDVTTSITRAMRESQGSDYFDASKDSIKPHQGDATFSRQFFQPELPIQLKAFTDDYERLNRENKKVQCSMENALSDYAGRKPKICDKMCQTRGYCNQDMASSSSRHCGFQHIVHKSTDRVWRNQVPRKCSIAKTNEVIEVRERLVSHVNYDNDKDVDESQSCNQTIVQHISNKDGGKFTRKKDKDKSTTNKHDDSYNQGIHQMPGCQLSHTSTSSKMIKNQSNESMSRQIAICGSKIKKVVVPIPPKTNHDCCYINDKERERLYDCLADLAKQAEQLQCRIVTLESKKPEVCSCSAPITFPECDPTCPGKTDSKAKTEVKAKKKESQTKIKSEEVTTLLCPCDVVDEILTQPDTVIADPCCCAVEERLAQQKAEMAEMLQAWNDCMACYRELAQSVKSVQQTVALLQNETGGNSDHKKKEKPKCGFCCSKCKKKDSKHTDFKPKTQIECVCENTCGEKCRLNKKSRESVDVNTLYTNTRTSFDDSVENVHEVGKIEKKKTVTKSKNRDKSEYDLRNESSHESIGSRTERCDCCQRGVCDSEGTRKKDKCNFWGCKSKKKTDDRKCVVCDCDIRCRQSDTTDIDMPGKRSSESKNKKKSSGGCCGKTAKMLCLSCCLPFKLCCKKKKKKSSVSGNRVNFRP